MFLLGAGLAVHAVLIIAGVVVVTNGAGEPINIFFRVVLGLLVSVIGLVFVATAIDGPPEASRQRGGGGSGGREVGMEGDGFID